MDKKAQTIDTYNTSAQSLAKKFDELGVRLNDIEEVFSLVEKSNPTVLEIGCGNGRDAEEIVRRTTNYLGIDISEQLIELARKKVPKGVFEVADIEHFIFPKNNDAIFAFASLIHVPMESLRQIMSNALSALNDKGIFRLSMKYSDEYKETTKEDEFGIRTYYLYSREDIEILADGFVIIKNEQSHLRGQEWLEVTLRKEKPIFTPPQNL